MSFDEKNEIENFIRLLSKLPGLGPRSGRRAALEIIKKQDQLLNPLKESFVEISEKIVFCDNCNNIDVISPCSICSDNRRDPSIICVVEEISDLWAIERAGAIKGYYHILGGVLNALDGIGPDQLHINKLIKRINEFEVTEVILALSATIDGQTTMHYLSDLLKDHKIRISKLAHGIPIGGELDYLDDGTLMQAILSRTNAD
ncbi:MAG: recombination mediator RecR [Hyphomicrobiales bacterium]|jgi:recombination protein RecR|nr:recombination mediator RecR [Hyphomicrobiales bacterium]|tara:strand:- start:1210 stop:1815 length:606 start_codon:yes stop_codon:yes gene_type:complete